MLHDGITATKDQAGQVSFVCRDCKVPGEFAYGAQNKDQLVYILHCPSCQKILGEWLTEEEKKSELKEFAAKV